MRFPQMLLRHFKAAVVTAMFITLAMSASAFGQVLQCDFEQLTYSTVGISSVPSIDSLGTRIAFDSSADLDLDGDGSQPPLDLIYPEIFLWDKDDGLTKITNANPEGERAINPSISGDGTRVGFEYLAGTQKDIYLYNGTAIEPITVTPLLPHANEILALNDDGTRLVFRSYADLTNDPSLRLSSTEVFLWEQDASLTQITGNTSPYGVNFLAIDGSGTLIAFSSAADLDPDVNNTDPNREVFLANTNTDPITFTQVTNTVDADNSYNAVSGNGEKLAFLSSADLAPTATTNNADGSDEVFLYDIGSENFQQITDGPGNKTYPKLSADGTKLVFYTEFDNYYQVFLFDVTTGKLGQVTPPNDGFYSFSAVINSDGTRIAFVSDDNLAPIDETWNNLDGNEEIFLAKNCTFGNGGDGDGDGIPNDIDNCLTVANPGQEQTGNNVGGPFGDACVAPDVTIPGNVAVEPGAIIESGVLLNKGVTVKAGAEVKANAIINKNSTVEANAIVGENAVLNQGSMVGEDAIIGKYVVLDRGVEVFERAKVGDYSTIGKDSDIFEDAIVGCFETTFIPSCGGAAFGAHLGRNVTVEAEAVVEDGAVIRRNITVTTP